MNSHLRNEVLSSHRTASAAWSGVSVGRLLGFGLGSPVGKPDWMVRHPDYFQRCAREMEQIDDFGYHPDGWPKLKEAYSAHYERMGVNAKAEQFIQSDGARGIIYHAVSGLLQPQLVWMQEHYRDTPDQAVAIVPDPCYGPFVESVERAGGEVRFVRCDSKHNYFEGIKTLLKRGVSPAMVFLNAFHNPTGEGATLQELQWLVQAAHEHGFVILSDRTYSELAFTGWQPLYSIFNVQGAWEVSFEIFTLSKILGLARERVGGGLGRKKFMRRVKVAKRTNAYGLSVSAEVNGAVALNDHHNAISSWANELEARAALWYADLPGFTMPQGGFFGWWDASEVVTALGLNDATELCNYMVTKTGVEMWSGKVFGTHEVAKNHVRISLGQPRPVIEEAIDRLKKASIIPGAQQPRLALVG